MGFVFNIVENACHFECCPSMGAQFVIGRNCVQHVFPAMPATSGYTREQALELLEAMGNDKARACCYFTYYRKFLDDQDKINAEQICKNCDCDCKNPLSKRRRTERNHCVEQ